MAEWMEEITVSQLQKKLESGERTSYELVLDYMRRVALIDKSGSDLNSFFEWNPECVYIAQAMDRERKHGKVRSMLHGIPVVLKANINTKDMMRTPAGSIALSDNFAPYDAFLVKKLRDAGAVIIGKTNMTELAGSVSRNMEKRYSSLGGDVKNPYVSDGDVWGSSNGSAVAVSANLCMLAVGTETNGSIIRPSHRMGIVGIKPTVGLVSRYGVMPICVSQDTAGPMARTVEDAAILLNVLAGEDADDPSTWELQDERVQDYTVFCRKDGLRGLRIGVNRGYYEDFTEEQIQIAEKAYQVMEQEGAFVMETNQPHLKCDDNVFLYEYRKCMGWYLSTMHETKCRTMLDMLNYYAEHPENGWKYGMDYITDALFKTNGTCTESVYLLDKLEAMRRSQKDGIDKLLDENNLDVLVCPGVTDLSPISGYPSVIVPAGYDKTGMPFGVTFVGRAFSEPLLIKAAYAFEQCTKARRAPVFS